MYRNSQPGRVEHAVCQPPGLIHQYREGLLKVGLLEVTRQRPRHQLASNILQQERVHSRHPLLCH